MVDTIFPLVYSEFEIEIKNFDTDIPVQLFVGIFHLLKALQKFFFFKLQSSIITMLS